MPRPAGTARNEDGQVLFLGTLPKGVTFPDLPGALCKVAGDPELWFPKPSNRAQAERAKEACGPCPVRAPCLKWALEHEQNGIWGGTTPRERQRIRRAMRASSSRATSASTKAVAA